jgi:hypothetical protein
MNRPIHLTPTQQRLIRGIDDRVPIELGDVALDNLDSGEEFS